MKHFRRFLTICALIASLSIVALANGGITQTPGVPTKPPRATTPAGDILTWLTTFVTGLGGFF